ncbi:MAG: Rod shape-determining protein MreC [Parcubacteria group bacterium]|nr:Rod shape-determining protein MreC [Parcubacteria group bacterium]
MKTNFLPKNSFRRKPRSRSREVLVVASVFVVGAFFFSYFGGYVSNVVGPLWHSNAFLSRGLTNLTASLRSKDALITENTNLKDQLASDEELIVSLRTIAASRDDLLSSFGRNAASGISANVLVHPPETPYDILVIDAGENLGVKLLSEVSTPEGSSIGSISDIFSKTARVKLYSTAGERTDAVLERGQVPVTLTGRGGGNLEFTLPRTIDVEIGDRIVTSTIDTALLGVVGSVDVTPTDSFKTVLVKSPINPSTLRHVLIKR